MEASTKTYILKNIIQITRAPPDGEYQSFWNLSVTDLQFFLEDPELNVCDETITFWIILRWIQQDLVKRRRFIYQLLLSIRWISINPDFIENEVARHHIVQACKDARHFVAYVKEQLESGKFRIDRPPPCSAKRDLNGNFLISPASHRSELIRKWSTTRLPRSLILVVGGWCDDSPSNTAEIYEPRSKKWKPTSRSLPPILQRPRAYHSVLYENGYMYVIGGYDGHNTYNSCDRYDLQRCHWQEMCGMHSRRCYVGVAFLDGCIYAFGGSDGSDSARLKSAEKFYPSRNIWKQLPDMHERRSDAGGCSLGRRVYVAGGFTGEECVFSFECFDTETNQWHRLRRMTMARSGVSVVAYQGRVVVLGGYDGRNRLISVESYEPSTNQWTMMKPMLTKRSNFTACVIEGKLVVIGGFNGNSTCSNVEYYDDGSEEIPLSLCPDAPREFQEIDDVRTSNEMSTLESLPMEQEIQTPCTSNTGADVHHSNTFQLSHKLGLRTDMAKWRHLPNMKMSRSALSCCVLTELSPHFLNSLIQKDS